MPRHLGHQLSCILVDNGLLRQNEEQEGHRSRIQPITFKTDLARRGRRKIEVPSMRWPALTDPQEKRKPDWLTPSSIASRRRPQKIEGVEFLAQGTLYPDVIESGAAPDGPAATIKLHHNVGGLTQRALGFQADRAAA